MLQIDWYGVDNESGGGRTGQVGCSALPNLALCLPTGPVNDTPLVFLPVTNPSERQISPATRAGRSIEV